MSEERPASIESRLRRLEDFVDLVQLINRYGPCADCGASTDAAALWTENGLYDAGDVFDAGHLQWTSRRDIAAMLDGDLHRSLIMSGCGHLTGVPHLEIDGDVALGTGYSVLMGYDEDSREFRVLQVTATSWRFFRETDGWRIQSRLNRNLNGDTAARELLESGVLRWSQACENG